MDKQQAARAIIAHALPIAAFDGWTQRTLNQAAQDAGYKRTDAIRVFPDGAIEAVDAFFAQSDEQMLALLKNYSLDTMKIRERIATLIRIRLEMHAPHREALRRALALHHLPVYSHRHLKSLYRTVDEMWYAAGDQSTDFNFYTKRLTLAAVYSATLTYWLDDHSEGFSATWDFLNRRIENVMQFEKAKHRLREWVSTQFSKVG